MLDSVFYQRLILLQNRVLKKKSLMLLFRLCSLSSALQTSSDFKAPIPTQAQSKISLAIRRQSHKKQIETILFMLLDKSYKTAGSKCNNFKISGSASLLQVVIMAIMAMLPFSPWGLSDRAYRFTLVGTGFSYSYSIYLIDGRPRAWNLQTIQLWLQSLIATKDFIYLLYCFVFVSSPMAIKFALVSVLCRSLELVTKY